MISIRKTGQKLAVKTPYHPTFPSSARDMGGKWQDPIWVFDVRDESRVKDLCLDLFGTDGSPCDLLTIRVVLSGAVVDKVGNDKEIYIAGRRIAWVFGRDDQRARLGEGVVIVCGRMCGTGSVRKPEIFWGEGTILEIRDVPSEMAKKVFEKAPELVQFLGSPVSPSPDEIVQVSEEAKKLMDERNQLASRMLEIDRLLLDMAPKRREIPVYEVANDLLDND